MPRPAGTTGRRILESAYELFSHLSRVGFDEIAAFTGITKRSLYYHFKSKDESLASALDRHHELSMTRIRKHEHRYHRAPQEMLGVLFPELAKWTARPGFAGAELTRIVMELADLPGHPARRQRSHCRSHCLSQGATALILIHGDRGYAEAAANAAKQGWFESAARGERRFGQKQPAGSAPASVIPRLARTRSFA